MTLSSLILNVPTPLEGEVEATNERVEASNESVEEEGEGEASVVANHGDHYQCKPVKGMGEEEVNCCEQVWSCQVLRQMLSSLNLNVQNPLEGEVEATNERVGATNESVEATNESVEASNESVEGEGEESVVPNHRARYPYKPGKGMNEDVNWFEQFCCFLILKFFL